MVHSAGFRVRMPPLFRRNARSDSARASERTIKSDSAQVAEVTEVSPKSADLGSRVRAIRGYSQFRTRSRGHSDFLDTRAIRNGDPEEKVTSLSDVKQSVDFSFANDRSKFRCLIANN